MQDKQTVTFYDNDHKNAFYKWLTQYQVAPYDIERISMFYALALDPSIRRNIELVYNKDRHVIKPKCLDEGFQTSGSLAIVKLAFSLYNDFRCTENIEIKPDRVKRAVNSDSETVYTHLSLTDELSSQLHYRNYYLTVSTPPSILGVFAYVDRDMIPYLFQAIEIRFGLRSK